MKLRNYIIIPFWSQHFSILHVDDNVKAGHFRIGQLMLKTKINNFLVITAEITESAPAKPITFYASNLATELKDFIHHYEEGLMCAGEFINQVYWAVDAAHNDADNSQCNMRITACDKMGCPAKKTPGSEKETARHEKFINDYDKR